MDMLSAQRFYRDLPVELEALLVLQREQVGRAVRLIAVGDISFSGRIEQFGVSKGWDALLSDFRPFFQRGQVVFGNLENSLQGLPSRQPRRPFTPLPESLRVLQGAGFHLINLAHNHILDNGVVGLDATIEGIRKVGITPLGVGKTREEAKALVRMDVGGIRLGWLTCGRTLLEQPIEGPKFWEFDEGELLSAVAEARQNVDILIVSVHIGLMFIDYPRPETQAFARQAIRAGANIILMHHAHVLQGIELVGANGIVCYNLGNLLFDWKEGDFQAAIVVDQQNEGAVFVFELDPGGIAQCVVLPTVTGDDCSVHWAVGARGNAILRRLTRISADVLENYVSVFERQRAARNTSHILQELVFQVRTRGPGGLMDVLKRFRREHAKMALRWLIQRPRR